MATKLLIDFEKFESLKRRIVKSLRHLSSTAGADIVPFIYRQTNDGPGLRLDDVGEAVAKAETKEISRQLEIQILNLLVDITREISQYNRDSIKLSASNIHYSIWFNEDFSDFISKKLYEAELGFESNVRSAVYEIYRRVRYSSSDLPEGKTDAFTIFHIGEVYKTLCECAHENDIFGFFLTFIDTTYMMMVTNQRQDYLRIFVRDVTAIRTENGADLLQKNNAAFQFDGLIGHYRTAFQFYNDSGVMQDEAIVVVVCLFDGFEGEIDKIVNATPELTHAFRYVLQESLIFEGATPISQTNNSVKSGSGGMDGGLPNIQRQLLCRALVHLAPADLTQKLPPNKRSMREPPENLEDYIPSLGDDPIRTLLRGESEYKTDQEIVDAVNKYMADLFSGSKFENVADIDRVYKKITKKDDLGRRTQRNLIRKIFVNDQRAINHRRHRGSSGNPGKWSPLVNLWSP